MAKTNKVKINKSEMLAAWAKSPELFFNTTCWTYDPRGHDNPNIEFELYDYQLEDIQTFEAGLKQGGFLIYEKSRSMGFSWTVTTWLLWHWLFGKEPFTALLGSYKSQRIDQKGNIDSLFEKLRYNLYKIPVWALPEGFERHAHDNYMRLLNPKTGSVISGDSPTEFGRAGRNNVIVADEFARWPDQNDVLAAMQQAGWFIIIGSTPHGKEMFWHMSSNPVYTHIRRHWTSNPVYREGLYKDEFGNYRSPWYDKQCEDIGVGWIIAQELDISYERSLGNRVYEEYRAEKNDYIYSGELDRAKTVWFWDFGVADELAIECFKFSEGQLWGYKEIIGNKASAEDWADLLDKHHIEGRQAEHIGDPAGKKRESDLSSWFGRLSKRGYRLSVSPYGSPLDMISNVRAMFSKELIHVDRQRQPRLVQCLESWLWKTVKTSAGEIALDVPVHDRHSHPGTALYYGCWELFNPWIKKQTICPRLFVAPVVSERPTFGGITSIPR